MSKTTSLVVALRDENGVVTGLVDDNGKPMDLGGSAVAGVTSVATTGPIKNTGNDKAVKLEIDAASTTKVGTMSPAQVTALVNVVADVATKADAASTESALVNKADLSDIDTKEFNKLPDHLNTNLPMLKLAEQQYINGVKFDRVDSKTANSRYRIPPGARISSRAGVPSYDSVLNTWVTLCTVDIPASAIGNGEYIDLAVTYTCPQQFGNAGTFGINLGSTNHQLNRPTNGIPTSTSATLTIRLTANDINQIVLNGINGGVVGTIGSVGFNVTNGSSTRKINTLAPFTIAITHRFTTADSAGRVVTATAVATINTVTPSDIDPANTVDPVLRPFSKDSFFNTPLSATVELQQPTDPETASFRANSASQIFWGGGSVNIYQAEETDPEEVWAFSSRASPDWYWPFKDTTLTNGTIKMRTPHGIQPAPSGMDNNIALISPCRRFYIEAWHYKMPADDPQGLGRHTCGSFTVHDLYGAGWPRIWDDISVTSLGLNAGVRAGGGPLMPGIVRKWELEAGVINHALVMIMSLGKQKKVAPFAVSQNASNAPAINAAGTGYKTGQVVKIVGGTGQAAELTITSVDPANGAVKSVWPTNTGSYTESPGTTALATTGGTGTGLTVNVTILTNDRSSSRVFPATNVDGIFGSYAGAVPLGALFTIPASVDVTTLGLTTPEAVTFARAIQQYGIYNMDSAPNPTTALFICGDEVDKDLQDKVTGRVNGTMPNLYKIAAQMVMVRNNAPGLIGGFGPRVVNQPLIPSPLF